MDEAIGLRARNVSESPWRWLRDQAVRLGVDVSRIDVSSHRGSLYWSVDEVIVEPVAYDDLLIAEALCSHWCGDVMPRNK